MQLDNQLYQLLYKNNCVILPGFGGFISNAKSAEIVAVQGYIKQPHKSFSFNKNLITNDGLVYNFIAQKLDITYNKAEEICKEFIQNIIHKLYQGESVVFYNIGKLYLDVEKNIQFFPSQNENFALSSFGLKDISIQPINYLQKVEEIIAIDNSVELEEEIAELLHQEDKVLQETYIPTAEKAKEEKVSFKKTPVNSGVKFKFRQLAAAIVVLSVISSAFLFLINHPSTSNFAQQSSIFETAKSLFFKKTTVQIPDKIVQPKVEKRTIPAHVPVAPVIESAPAEITQAPATETVAENNTPTALVPANTATNNTIASAAPVADKKNSPAVTVDEAKKITPSPITPATNASANAAEVSLVFGSFKSEENASVLLNKLKKEGINAIIINTDNGFKRVIYRTKNNQAETIKSTHPGSWIL